MAPQAQTSTPPRPAGTSRLLAMKFMSRLGPTDTTPTASSPLVSSNPSTPTNQRLGAGGDGFDDNERSSKRRRTSGALSEIATAAAAAAATGSPVSAAASGTSMADMEATMRASIDEEERRRQLAIKKRAAELGDEHWTWNAPLPPQVAATLAASKQATQAQLPYNVVRVGYAEIDQSTAADNTPAPVAYSSGSGSKNTKPTIMRFNMKQAVTEETEDNDDHDARQSKKRTRSDVDAYSKKKDMPKLKNLTSLSSQGGQSSMKCHRCGKPGHKAMECPSAPKRTGSKRR